MISTIQSILAPYYLHIKLVHLIAVSMWFWSTSVAFVYYVVPVMQNWRRNQQDQELVELRNWVFERFDQGVVLEHIAFPLLIITGLLMLIVGGWTTESSWLVLKLAIVTAIFIPIEIFDYYISHFSGNKRFIRDAGDELSYEKAVHKHWWFLLITTPAIVIFPLTVFFLAVVKPTF